MSTRKPRLAPEEVREILENEKARGESKSPQSTTPFHSPFAALKDDLQKLVPKKRTAAQRLRGRAEEPPAKRAEPSELAKARARARAAREELAAAVKPVRRAKKGDDDRGGE